MWGKIKRYYSPYVDLISFSILILTVINVAYYYNQLPNEIPTHFNAAGDPDAWSGKVMLIGLTILYMFIFIHGWALNYLLLISPQDSKEALQFINIPFLKKEELDTSTLEWIRQITARMLASTNGIVSLLFAYTIYGIIQTALGKQNGLGLIIIWIISALVLNLIYYSWKIYRIASIKEENM